MTLFARLRMTSCCGLVEWYGLQLAERQPGYLYGERPLSLFQVTTAYPGRAVFATTTNDQKKEVKALQALGFQRVDKWRNGNTGRSVTFWFYQPNASKRKKNVPE